MKVCYSFFDSLQCNSCNCAIVHTDCSPKCSSQKIIAVETFNKISIIKNRLEKFQEELRNPGCCSGGRQELKQNIVSCEGAIKRLENE